CCWGSSGAAWGCPTACSRIAPPAWKSAAGTRARARSRSIASLRKAASIRSRDRIAGSMARAGKLSGGFISIIVFKSFKGVVFLLVGLAAMHLARMDRIPTAEQIARFLRSSPENEIIQRIANVTPRQVVGISILSLFVGMVFTVEATLLAFRVWWSTYFTIGLTMLGIPLELYEIAQRPFGIRRYLILIVNVAILVYLWKRRNEFRTTEARR